MLWYCYTFKVQLKINLNSSFTSPLSLTLHILCSLIDSPTYQFLFLLATFHINIVLNKILSHIHKRQSLVFDFIYIFKGNILIHPELSKNTHFIMYSFSESKDSWVYEPFDIHIYKWPGDIWPPHHLWLVT